MNKQTQIDAIPPLLADLPAACAAAEAAVRSLLDAARDRLGARMGGGRVSNRALEAEQSAAHALAWLATYAESLTRMRDWAEALEAEGRLGEMERLILQIGFGEYLAQVRGGIPMSQGEMARPGDVGLEPDDLAALDAPLVAGLTAEGNTDAARRRLVELMIERDGTATFGETGLDEEYGMIREQFRRFSDDRVAPNAHEWHLKDELIPMEIIAEMGELGVFGLTIPEEYGGFGMSKTAMCVVSEELSRGYIGVGSLGTRSGDRGGADPGWRDGGAEAGVAAEARQRRDPADGGVHRAQYRVRSGEPADAGGQGRRGLRRDREQDLDHPCGADRRDDDAGADGSGDGGSFGAVDAAGGEAARDRCGPLPRRGDVGRRDRGARLSRDEGIRARLRRVPGEDREPARRGRGPGFRQLMRTFESARIQTAARAIGVAQNALDLAMRYAMDRKQFGKALIEFPRVYGKLAMMAVEIMIARQLTYHSAREKDAERRCDLEAGMAKLLGARVAWAAADNGLQIHGGNGFALEYPISRVLCDARILNIFEGAAEIQAQVIARRLLEKEA